jgi:hypothetical protein
MFCERHTLKEGGLYVSEVVEEALAQEALMKEKLLQTSLSQAIVCEVHSRKG